MDSPSAPQVLQREFLTIRCRLIDLAAALDRLDRASGSVADDPQRRAIQQSLEILAADGPGRAARVQEAFSLPYDENWQA